MQCTDSHLFKRDAHRFLHEFKLLGGAWSKLLTAMGWLCRRRRLGLRLSSVVRNQLLRTMAILLERFTQRELFESELLGHNDRNVGSSDVADGLLLPLVVASDAGGVRLVFAYWLYPHVLLLRPYERLVLRNGYLDSNMPMIGTVAYRLTGALTRAVMKRDTNRALVGSALR